MSTPAVRTGDVPSAPVRAEAVPACLPPRSLIRLVRAWSLGASHASGTLTALPLLLLLVLSGLLIYVMSIPEQPVLASESAPLAENDLRPLRSSSTPNSTSAETSIRLLAPTPPAETVVPPIREPEPLSPPPVAPPPETRGVPVAPPVVPPPAELPVTPPAELPVPPAVVPPPVPFPEPPPAVRPELIQVAAPPVPHNLVVSHPGDSPMTNHWNQVTLPTLLVAALAASPTYAQADGDPDKVDSILSQLKSLTKSVQDLKGLPANLGELEKKIAAAEKRLADQLANQDLNANLRFQAMQREVNSLKEQQTLLRQEFEAMRKQTPTRQPSVALYPPGGNNAATGRLRLRNTFPDSVSIVVNNRPAVRLEPNEEVLLDAMPSGLFTYEVLGIQTKTTRSLAPGEIFTIHVYPR